MCIFPDACPRCHRYRIHHHIPWRTPVRDWRTTSQRVVRFGSCSGILNWNWTGGGSREKNWGFSVVWRGGCGDRDENRCKPFKTVWYDPGRCDHMQLRDSQSMAKQAWRWTVVGPIITGDDSWDELFQIYQHWFYLQMEALWVARGRGLINRCKPPPFSSCDWTASNKFNRSIQLSPAYGHNHITKGITDSFPNLFYRLWSSQLT